MTHTTDNYQPHASERSPVTTAPKKKLIEVSMPLKGVKTGPGAYGADNQDISYKTGNSMISIYDANKHTLKVKKNGKLVRTFPATSGKPGFDTRERC